MAIQVLITLVLVLLNGFFVAAEFAIVKIRASQLEQKAQEGNPMAVLSKKIVANLDGYLAATQFGITLASLGLGWIGEPVVSKILIGGMELVGISLEPELAHQIALPAAFAIITVLHIVFGELAPKSIAIQRPEATTLFLSYPLHGFYLVFRPVVWMLNGIANFILKGVGITPSHGSEVHSSDELRYLVQQQKDSGMIEAADYDLIKNAFNFSERIAKQIMIPRPQVFGIDINDFDEAKLEKVIEEGYSRIPVYEDTLDQIVGVLHLKDLLLRMRQGKEIVLNELIRPISTVHESKPIGALLRDFQLSRQQMAVIIDEYGGVDGIVTMEDILEELVGEIQDEYDNEIPIVKNESDNTYTVLGSASITDINDKLPHDISKESDYETLAGYLIYKFGRIPAIGEKLKTKHFEFTILKKQRATISQVKITVFDD
ncbi:MULTISPECIES: hemolysin family protein [Dyadobacter]|uniref:Hemolysin family protein n=1 Tax=Dyadobacter chenhuakuii TaxID=2909339 RepID=A0A9X1QBR5_9BACT|nr:MULTISPECIES: hemolysin family protein [Dyadobacter]MCE7069515.1 hemolysin family protein [Dyadobacter sp. CY327]MCF2498810.1 hemolysin family protein [Dyadobacter chenhuakuii]MCF2516474.1 hemolysin family protein [Dyadobacter sp. CY351]